LLCGWVGRICHGAKQKVEAHVFSHWVYKKAQETLEWNYILDHTNAKDIAGQQRRGFQQDDMPEHARICESLELAASVKKTELSLTSGLYSAIIRLSNLTRSKCSARITSAFQWENGKQPFKPVSW